MTRNPRLTLEKRIFDIDVTPSGFRHLFLLHDRSKSELYLLTNNLKKKKKRYNVYSILLTRIELPKKKKKREYPVKGYRFFICKIQNVEYAKKKKKEEEFLYS